MPFLIYTDRENLGRSVNASRIRIPSSLSRVFDLSRIAPGDLLFLFEFASGKTFGPLYAGTGGLRIEKNPRGGPFNGYGKVQSHYTYHSIEADCSSLLPRGALVGGIGEGTGPPRFELTAEEGRAILQKLRLVNRKKTPLVLQMRRTREALEMTVVEMEGGTRLSRHLARAGDAFFALVERRTKALEELFLEGKTGKYESALRQLGALLYDTVLEPCGLDRLFARGGYAIDMAADPSLFSLPFELAFKDFFLFENNIVSFRRLGEEAVKAAVPVNRALVIADPAVTHDGAYREGTRLHRLFADRGVPADLVCRPLEKGAVNDLLASYDLVHFCGHWASGSGASGWNTGADVFGEGDVVPSRSLPSLVFSSACGNALPLARSLSEAGVGNVIASRWRVPDDALERFAHAFYSLLLDGLEIGTAFNESIVRAYVGGNPHPLSFFHIGEGRRTYEFANRRR